MELANIKELLPDGSYMRIARKVGRSKGTIAQFFAENVKVRIGEDLAEEIKKEALAIIEEQKEKAEAVLEAHAEAA
jgi:hypothetical protein